MSRISSAVQPLVSAPLTWTRSSLARPIAAVMAIAASDFVLSGSEIDDRHLSAETVERVIAGGDDAARGVEDQAKLGVFFEGGKHFVEDGNLCSEVFRFAPRVARAVRPAHPGSHPVNALVATRCEDPSEARFDVIVRAERRAAERRKMFCPV